MKSLFLLLALIFPLTELYAEPPPSPLVELDYGDTNCMMHIVELERNTNTSLLRFTYKKMGPSVGSSLFTGSAFYKIAKNRGVKYYTVLKEWEAPGGGYYYVGGFSDDNTIGIQEQFGNEYSPTNRAGKPRVFLSVSKMSHLFEWSANLTDSEREAEEHMGILHQGNVNAATNEMERFVALWWSIRRAKRPINLSDVRETAKELERMAPQCKGAPSYGSVVQDFNQILGRIALAEGNVDEAKKRLLASAYSDGSPTMNSFGPNMTLAKELLLKREREVVLQYFDLCRKFWGRHSDKLDLWTEDVKSNRIPKFGANLKY
ncbi:MAG: hypothetical protein PHI93_10210 [Kiritimatiellae bacterium]|nr:hypothetical protein [Kiritimatiellia bacterium]